MPASRGPPDSSWAPALPAYAQGNLLSGEAGFPTDCGTGSQGVKFAAYLEPLTAASGALQLMPGSHHADFGAAGHWSLPAERGADHDSTWPDGHPDSRIAPAHNWSFGCAIDGQPAGRDSHA